MIRKKKEREEYRSTELCDMRRKWKVEVSRPLTILLSENDRPSPPKCISRRRRRWRVGRVRTIVFVSGDEMEREIGRVYDRRISRVDQSSRVTFSLRDAQRSNATPFVDGLSYSCFELFPSSEHSNQLRCRLNAASCLFKWDLVAAPLA